MKKFIHIGFPKNFSTALQRNYFSKHPNIFHLGIGKGSNLGYVDDEIEIATEVYLKYARDFKYAENENRIKNAFDSWFNRGTENPEIKYIGYSSEHFSFPFTNDVIDSTIIARRLFEIFGPETNIIMILRNQFDLLKSLYKESVRVGYAGDFKEYMNYIYQFQERNYLYSFLYHNIYDAYSRLFGKENVGVFFFEDYRDNDSNKNIRYDTHGNILLLKHIGDFLSLPYEDLEFSHYNESLNDGEISGKYQLNKSISHDLGNSLMNGAENHRIIKYLKKDLSITHSEEYFYQDVLTKRKLIAAAKAVPSEDGIDYNVDKKVYESLKDLFAKSNQELCKKLNSDLPEKFNV